MINPLTPTKQERLRVFILVATKAQEEGRRRAIATKINTLNLYPPKISLEHKHILSSIPFGILFAFRGIVNLGIKMQIGTVFRIIGLLLTIFSFSMLTPIPVAWWYGDGGEHAFLIAFALTLVNGLLLWLPFRHYHRDLTTRDGFLIVVLFWGVLSFYAALPFVVATFPHIHLTDGTSNI